ncbi:hypothetical protein V8J36_11395 [Frigidibacter sp. MR17.14]|uniref:hypothetical protein n=1 Tax=Frigidibacter sp. MR17.14 TaxID=3126509 RepID=UPI003012BBC7
MESASTIAAGGLPATAWIQIILLCLMVGMCGQVIRSIAGVKKLNDQVQQVEGARLATSFEGGRFLRSLMIGGVAGVLAGLGLIKNVAQVETQAIFAILAAGYSGADFVEAFMRKAAPDLTIAPAAATAPPATVAVTASAAPAVAPPATAPALAAPAAVAAIAVAPAANAMPAPRERAPDRQAGRVAQASPEAALDETMLEAVG